MTHSLHRLGKEESLKKDYIVLIFGSKYGPFSGVKMFFRRKFPDAFAFVKGLMLWAIGAVKKLRKQSWHCRDNTTKNTVLNSREELKNYLARLKEKNTGESVVVSGLIDEVDGCLREIGAKPHTVQFSLGYFGNKELLPDEKTLEITTMCGHHLISPNLVKKLAGDIKEGIITQEEAAEAMSRLCHCGIFNKDRIMREGLD